MKIYRVNVCGWISLEYSATFSNLHNAMKRYNEKLNEELKRELESKKDKECYPYMKNDVDIFSLVENEDGEFVFSEKIAEFEGDQS
jgi:predicted extracellular nuclease